VHEQDEVLMRSAEHTRVLYLAGIPRTGSTVLGQALAGLPGVVFAGELNFFWRRYANRELCSCGQPLPECPLWSEVVTKAFGAVTAERASELSALEERVVDRQRLFALSPLRWPRPPARDLRPMLELRDELYATAAAATGASWLVDGGKEPVFGRLMTGLKRTEVSTIHIVRDPRGVAFSWMKRVRSDSEPGEMPSRPPLLSAVEWILQNLMIHISLQRLSRSYVRVRYEDLVTDLPGVVSAVARAAGLPAAADAALAGGGLAGSGLASTGQAHLVAGNPGVRRQAAKTIKLTLDDAWRTQLPRMKQRLITVICAPLMAAYGYPLGSGPGPAGGRDS
jgi:Sulfotransferase family